MSVLGWISYGVSCGVVASLALLAGVLFQTGRDRRKSK